MMNVGAFKYLSKTSYIISGTVLIMLGIMIIAGGQKLMRYVMILLSGVFLLRAMTKGKEKILNTVADLGLFIVFLFWPDVPLVFLSLFFVFYLSLDLFVYWFNVIISWHHHVPSRWKDLGYAIFLTLFALAYLFSPYGHLPTLLALTGIYLILLGLSQFKQLILESIPPRQSLKRDFRLPLPILVEAITPRLMLNYINRCFKDREEPLDESLYMQKKSDEPVDLEIFIHTSPLGFNQFGHMDLLFENVVYSFGNYDYGRHYWHDTLGDGVMFTSVKQYYIPFAIERNEKTMIGFGIRLNEQQKARMRKKIADIMKDAYEWYPPASQAYHENPAANLDQYDDYSSALFKETAHHTRFYKFSDHTYQTYFLWGATCTLFADQIIGEAGIDIVKLKGLITPGTYLDYLEREFHRKNSMVIRKTIYNDRTKEIAIAKTT